MTEPSAGTAGGRFSFAFDEERFSDRVLCLVLNPESPLAGFSGYAAKLVKQSAPEPRYTPVETKGFVSDREQSAGAFGGLESKESKLRRAPSTEKRTVTRDLSQVRGLDEDDSKAESATASSSPDSSLPVIRKLHVSSVILAADSAFFKALLSNGMRESREREIRLEVCSEDEADRVAVIVRFLYTGLLSGFAPGAELLPLLLLADRLGVSRAVEAVSRLMSQDGELTVERCAAYLELDGRIALGGEHGRELLAKSKAFLAAQFKNLDATWESDRFMSLPLKAVVAILQSDTVEVRCENTVFQAARTWFLRNGKGMHSAFSLLLDGIRFPMLTNNFLLDVVMKMKPLFSTVATPPAAAAAVSTGAAGAASPSSAAAGAAAAAAALSDEAAAAAAAADKFAELCLEAVEFNMSSRDCPERAKALATPAVGVSAAAAEMHVQKFTRRPMARVGYQLVYDWKLEAASKLADNYQFSPRFVLDGYFFLLGAGKVKRAGDGESSLGLYLYLDLAKTGVTGDRLFLKGDYELGATNRGGNYVSLWTGKPVYSKHEIGLGRHDLFGKKWSELFADQSPSGFVDPTTDTIKFTVKLRVLM